MYEKALDRTLSKDLEYHITEKGVKFVESLQFCAHFRSSAPSVENSGCKSISGQKKGEARKISAWQMTKVKSKKEVIRKHKEEKEGIKTNFFQKKKRVVHRGDIVIDCSCNRSNECRCKTTRLCRKTADAASAHTLESLKDAQKLLNIPKSVLGYIFHDTSGQSHGQKLKIQGSIWTKFLRTPTCWPLVGKTVV